MITKKETIIVLFAFCLASAIFTVMPVSSSERLYDPWLDLNDDGKIDLKDVYRMHVAYPSEGAAINKTALLFEVNATYTKLLGRIETLNTTLLNMETNLTTRIVNVEATVAMLQSKIDILNATLAEAQNIVGYAIASSNTLVGTTETLSWIDMTDMSVTLTLNRSCNVLIMFSTEARNTANNDVLLRATVNLAEASPGFIDLTPVTIAALGNPYTHIHNLDMEAHSYTFYSLDELGTVTVKMQWRVNGGTGYAGKRTLIVIALPA